MFDSQGMPKDFVAIWVWLEYTRVYAWRQRNSSFDVNCHCPSTPVLCDVTGRAFGQLLIYYSGCFFRSFDLRCKSDWLVAFHKRCRCNLLVSCIILSTAKYFAGALSTRWTLYLNCFQFAKHSAQILSNCLMNCLQMVCQDIATWCPNTLLESKELHLHLLVYDY